LFKIQNEDYNKIIYEKKFNDNLKEMIFYGVEPKMEEPNAIDLINATF